MFLKNLILLTVMIGTNAHSACISYRYRPVLWNPKGDSVIILRQGFGSENGAGSVDLFITRANMELTQLQISSTIRSDGNISPEAVTREDCLKNLKQFNLTLALYDFPNLMHESTCKPERDYLFNKKIDTTTPIEEKKQTELFKKLEYTLDASAFSKNQVNFVVAQTKATCTAECFWVIFDKDKNLYNKKGACLTAP